MATQFDCCISNLNRWEENKAEPTAKMASKIIAYLGFNPLPKTTFGQRIKAARLEAGLFQRELAGWIGTDVKSLSLWERDRALPVKHWDAVTRFAS